ncbi:MAG TPA: arginine--tRNA ligase [Candidatus Woesebacteria bacterium]|nr:arginine--tRNA ligase [Candidatus Woesebacteria bacterium]
MKEYIAKLIQKAVIKLRVNIQEIAVSNPTHESFGDYSSSIAMQLAKQMKKNPVAVAQEIVDKLPSSEQIEKVDIVKPGFINFWISKETLINNLSTINDTYGNSKKLSGQNIILEYTDPNPFKEMHIGHLYSNTIGESLSRLLGSQGANIKRANYQGDVGMHVAKSIWGLQKKMEEKSITLEDLDKKNLSEKVKFLGQAYAMGATAYEENEAAAQEMKDINYLVYASAQEMLIKIQNWEPQINYKQFIRGSKWNLEEVKALYISGRKWSLDYFETIYKKLGTKFDFYFFESVVGEFGVKIVKEYLEKGVFTESNGAIIFKGENYGLHTRVFINSLGLPTYEAKELGLAPTKYKQFKYDKSIIITGNEIKEYFKVLLTALKQINPELADKTTHITHGMVRLPEGKMSSRTGKVLTAEWLIDEVQQEVSELVNKSPKVDKKDKTDVSEKLTIAAIKYSFLKNGIGKDIAFDFNESLSMEGNSGPYLEYTLARCNSILASHFEQLGKRHPGLDPESQIDVSGINNDERLILSHLLKFPEVVQSAASNYAPQIITTYLFDLAQKYNLFYTQYPILKAKEQEKAVRLLLTKATAQVLKNGLYLLGIKTVEKM